MSLSPLPKEPQKGELKMFNGFKDLTKHVNSEKVQKFLNIHRVGNKFRTHAIVLQARKFQFEDEKSKQMVEGLTLTCTEGTIHDEDRLKGLSISEYSLKGKEYLQLFDSIPETPFDAILEFRMNNKKKQFRKYLENGTNLKFTFQTNHFKQRSMEYLSNWTYK